MKKLISITVLILVLAACAPQAQPTGPALPPNDSYPNGSYPNGSYPNTDHSSADLTPAQRAAIAALSVTLNLPADQIELVSTEAVTWPDGCLGVTRMGMMCTQALVDGFRIVLEANDEQYEFHTNQDGSVVVQAVLSADATAVENVVRDQLASNLGIDKAKISVVSDVAVEFPDSCMGVAMENVMCAQIVTPGRIIVLEANAIQYEYHTSEDGSVIQPATLALVWKREGGIAGFCDSLTVFLSGEIYGGQCKLQSDGAMKTFADVLSKEERQQFDTWSKELGQVNLDASNPVGVADRMIVTLAFYGNGHGTLTKSNEQKIFQWAQEVFQKLYP